MPFATGESGRLEGYRLTPVHAPASWQILQLPDTAEWTCIGRGIGFWKPVGSFGRTTLAAVFPEATEWQASHESLLGAGMWTVPFLVAPLVIVTMVGLPA